MYRPIERSLQMNTPATHRKPTGYQNVNGRDQKLYQPKGVILGHYKEKSGGETIVNGLKVVTKSITFTCWYNPALEEKDQLIIMGKVYEITNIEDVEMRHRYMTCELESVEAGA